MLPRACAVVLPHCIAPAGHQPAHAEHEGAPVSLHRIHVELMRDHGQVGRQQVLVREQQGGREREDGHHVVPLQGRDGVFPPLWWQLCKQAEAREGHACCWRSEGLTLQLQAAGSLDRSHAMNSSELAKPVFLYLELSCMQVQDGPHFAADVLLPAHEEQPGQHTTGSSGLHLRMRGWQALQTPPPRSAAAPCRPPDAAHGRLHPQTVLPRLAPQPP